MDFKYRNALLLHRDTIANRINVGDMLDYLRRDYNFTLDEEEQITCNSDEKVRAEELIKVLLRKSNEAFVIFLEALSEAGNYKDLLNILKEECINPMKILNGINNALVRGSVPLQPPNYISREDYEINIRREIKDLACQPAWVVIWGAGGAGKSTLCAEALRSEDILRLYPGGIEWLHVGHFDSDEQMMVTISRFFEQLHIEGRRQQLTPIEAKRIMCQHLQERPGMLLILDNVWDTKILQVFDLSVPIVVSTRDKTICDEVQGSTKPVHVSEALSAVDSKNLLSKWTNRSALELPAEADQLIEQSQGLPLALVIIGAHLREFPEHWEYCKNRFLRIKRRSPYAYSTVKEALRIGIEALDESLKTKYLSLAVFPKGIMFSPETVALLWKEEKDSTESILKDLTNKSLLKEEFSKNPQLDSKVYVLHDFLKDVLDEITTDKKSLHSQMVTRFMEACDNNWSELDLRDEYIWRYIGYHHREAGLNQEFIALYSNPEFLAIAICKIGPFAILADMKTYASEKIRSDVNWLTTLSILEENMSSLSEITCLERKEQETRVLEAIIQSSLYNEHQTYIFKKSLSLAQKTTSRFWILQNPQLMSVTPSWKAQVTNKCYSLHLQKQRRCLAVGGRKGDVTIIHAETGQIKTTLSANIDINTSGQTTCLWNKTGELFAASTSADSLCLYEMVEHGSNLNLREKMTFSTNSKVTTLLFDGDDQHVIVGLVNGDVMRYSLENSEIPPTEVTKYEASLQGLAISADGSFLGAAVYTKSYHIYSFETHQNNPIEIKEPNTLPRRLIDFTTFGDTEVVVCFWHRSIKIWNPVTNEEVDKTFLLPGLASSFATEPDIDLIAGGDHHGTIMVWKYSTGTVHHVIESTQWQTRLLFYLPVRDPVGQAMEVAVIAGNMDGLITRWPIDVNTDPETIQYDKRSDRHAFAAHLVRQDELRVLTQDEAMNVELIIASDKKELKSFKHPVSSTVLDVAISPTGLLYAVGLSDGTIQIYRLSKKWWTKSKTFKLKLERKQQHQSRGVTSIIFLSNESIISADSEGFVVLFDHKKNMVLKEWRAHEPHPTVDDYATSLRFLPQQDRLLTAGRDLHLKMWDLRSTSREPFLVVDISTDHKYDQFFFDVDPGEKIVVTLTWRDEISKVWSLATGDLLFELHHELDDQWIFSCSVCTCSPTLILVATGDRAGTMRIYHMNVAQATGGALEPLMKFKEFSASSKYIAAMSWTPSGDTLWAADDDRLYCWKYDGQSTTEAFPLRFGRLGGRQKLTVNDKWIVSKSSQGKLNILHRMNGADVR